MAAMDMVRIPAEALAAARLTRLAALESFREGPLDIEELRPRFLDRLKARGARKVVFGPQSYSLDSLIDEQVICGVLALDDQSRKYSLTKRGLEELEDLERRLQNQPA